MNSPLRIKNMFLSLPPNPPPPPPPPNHAAENQVARQRRCNEASIFFNKHVASLDLYWYNDYVKFLESDRSYEARALINFLSFRMGAYSRGRFIEALL